MSDALGIQEHSVVQICNIFLVSLSSVEEARQVVSHSLVLLHSQNLRHELLDSWRILFLVDHVEPSNQVWVLLFRDADVVKDFVNMRVSDELVARKDQLHLEVGHLFPCFINDLLNDRNFFQEWYWLLVFIKDASRRVPYLDNENVLLDA